MHNTNTWVSIALALILTSPVQSFASEVTDIADAVDTIKIGDHTKQDLFDAYLSTSFELRFESGIIAREGVSADCSQNNPSGCEPVEELQWNKSTSTLNIDAEIGLFRDLSFTLRLPIIVGQSLSFEYADGITAAVEFDFTFHCSLPISLAFHLYEKGFCLISVSAGGMGVNLCPSVIQASRASVSATWSRRTFFRIFPAAVRGKVSMISSRSGYFCFAIPVFSRNAMRSSNVRSASSSSTTKAQPVSPMRG